MDIIENYSVSYADRLRRVSNDEFFHDGDILCHGGCNFTTVFYQEESTMLYEKEESFDMITEEYGVNNVHEDGNENKTMQYPCALATCSRRFASLFECEAHYQESHVHVCIDCGRVFPSHHWLDLHIQESHDIFFTMRVEKYPNRPGYKCLFPDCSHANLSAKERMHHLRSYHSLPKWFRFHFIGGMNNNVCKIIKQKQVKKKTTASDKHRSNCTNFNNMENSNTDDKTYLKSKKRRERKERKKEKYAKIPCKFFFPKGVHKLGNDPPITGTCHRGNKCMFSHTIGISNDSIYGNDLSQMLINEKTGEICENVTPTSDAMDGTTNTVDDFLSNSMRKALKVSVPSKIAFGKRNRL